MIKLDLLIFDFDGVFTDNKVIITDTGQEAVVCSRSDGIGLDMLRKVEIKMFIISTEANPVVGFRAKKLRIDFEQGVDDKRRFLREYCKKNSINLKKVGYIGNDINDLEVMKIVGLPIVPLNAHYTIKDVARLILPARGGEGTIRAFAEYYLNFLELNDYS